MSDNPYYDTALCYECALHGDNYYWNEDGETICACKFCPRSPYYIREDNDLY